METSPITEKQPLIYRIYRVLVIPALLYYALMIFYIFTRPELDVPAYDWWTRYLSVFAVTPVTIGLGWLIMRRVRGNVIGPALIVFACFTNTEFVNSVLLPDLQVSLNAPILVFCFVFTFVIILTHFPTGKVFPAKITTLFYTYLVVSLLSMSMSFLSNELAYGYAMDGSQRPNQLYVPSLAAFQWLGNWGVYLTQGFMISSIILLIYRYLQTNQTERQQLRWLVFGVTITFIPATPVLLIPAEAPLDEGFARTLISMVAILILAVIPFSIGISILFHRLWDIDVIIRRTFTYSIVSLILVGSYFLIVLASQAVLHTVIGNESSLTVVISTLAVAVLFNPVRERVQQVVDRLFYRKRYNAQEIVEQFSDHIRDATEPANIEQELLQTITKTIQPQSISLWVIND